MRPIRLVILTLAVAAITVSAPPLSAQGTVIGTFRWQLQPFCNVVTVTVVQLGAVYHVDGTDDQCGASRAASVVGLAFPNPDGSIGFGLTTVTTPGGTALHTDARITLATVSGTWTDSAGNSGNYVLTPGAGNGGSARVAPPGGIGPGTITGSQIAAGTITATQIAPGTIPSGGVADGSITTAKLADASVTTAKVADGSVTTAKLADVSVTNAKLADGSVTATKIAAGALTRALQCQDTANTTVAGIAPGGTANASAPACAVGYTQTATNCEATSWLVPFVFIHGGTCSARNNDSTPQDIRASRTCCRVP